MDNIIRLMFKKSENSILSQVNYLQHYYKSLRVVKAGYGTGRYSGVIVIDIDESISYSDWKALRKDFNLISMSVNGKEAYMSVGI